MSEKATTSDLLERARGFIEAFNDSEVDAVMTYEWLSLWHPECTLEDLAEGPDPTSYRGRAGVAAFFRRALPKAVGLAE